MNIAGLLFVLFAHYFTGKGMLKLLKAELNPLANFCFSMIIGVVIISFAPCILQLLHIPLVAQSVAVAIAIITVAFSIPLFFNFKMPKIGKITFPALYEWPFLIIIIILIALSVWRCFYFPPYARDMLSGPELVSEYAVREHTFINSVYNIDLHTSNNYFKSPYITSLQIIYKLLVCPFGQLWLSVLFVSFIVWVYSILKERVHPFLAAALLLFFMAIPELYAYSYVLLYDYSNMIFFFSGFYFLVRYLIADKRSYFLFSIFLFAFATYIRTETLILLGMLSTMPLYYFYKWKIGIKKIAWRIGLFLVIPAIFYFVCINIFVRLFVPLPFNLSSNLNPNLSNVHEFFDRLTDMQTQLVFTPWGLALYGYFIYTFYILVAADFIFKRRKYSEESKLFLYGVAVVIVGLAFIGYLLPLADLSNTTKRGMFKMIPLILLYMADSSIVQSLSRGLSKWENPPAKNPVAAAKNVKVPQGKAVKNQQQPNKKMNRGK